MFSFIFMILSGAIPLVILMCMANYYLRHTEKYTMQQRFRLAHKFISVCEIFSGTKPRFYGLENIPDEEDGGFLIIPNHQGKYDALAIIHAFDYPVSVLMEIKKSMMPGAKHVVDLIDGERIDLTRPRQQLRVIREIGAKVRDGSKFIVFPEGGYTDNRNSLQEFHNGCFFSAYIARCPILPVCLVDTYASMNRMNILRRVHPEIHILPPIPYEAYKDMSRTDLAEYIRGIIENKMKEVLAARGEQYVSAYVPEAAEHSAPQAEMHTECI